MSDGELLVSEPGPGVRLLTLNRPAARNALSNELLGMIAAALEAARDDATVRCVVITGSDKVFAAGADIKELATRDTVGALLDVRPLLWERIRKFPKPLIAAVLGYALGGGCELAMHADIIVAGEGAKFGQPEINLGIIPGAGGTQRLPRLVGQQLAMKLILTGEMLSAGDALSAGLVAEVATDADAVTRAVALAETIAAKSPIAVRLAKEAVLAARDVPLEQGLALERKLFSALFGTRDAHEGLAAFIEKRQPNFEGR
jgi:enoyl-CoA hydratase